MKHLILACSFFFLITACNREAVEPKFQKIENITVDDLTATKVSISADAVVYNPNPVSVYLNSIDLDVFANDMKVGKVVQTKQTEIAKKDNFAIPLNISFNPKELFKDNLYGLLESALNSYTQQKVQLSFVGSAQFEVKGIKFMVPITYEDEILLKEE